MGSSPAGNQLCLIAVQVIFEPREIGKQGEYLLARGRRSQQVVPENRREVQSRHTDAYQRRINKATVIIKLY